MGKVWFYMFESFITIESLHTTKNPLKMKICQRWLAIRRDIKRTTFCLWILLKGHVHFDDDLAVAIPSNNSNIRKVFSSSSMRWPDDRNRLLIKS